MADAISSTSGVVSGVQLAAQAVQVQLASDRTAPGSATAAKAAAKTSTPQPSPAGSSRNSRLAKSAQSLDKAVKSLQDYIKPQEEISLQVDKESGQTYVKIVNTQTKQLILQIPSAQVLAMACKLREAANPQAAAGVLVDREG